MPAQGLGCQRASCTLKVGAKGQGPRRHRKGTEPGLGHQRAALPRSAEQAWYAGSQEALRGQEAPYLCPHWPLGSMGSRGEPDKF